MIKEQRKISTRVLKESVQGKNLNIVRARKNSRKTRECMVAYLIFLIQNDGENRISFDVGELMPCTVLASKIEKIKQNVRTH